MARRPARRNPAEPRCNPVDRRRRWGTTRRKLGSAARLRVASQASRQMITQRSRRAKFESSSITSRINEPAHWPSGWPTICAARASPWRISGRSVSASASPGAVLLPAGPRRQPAPGRGAWSVFRGRDFTGAGSSQRLHPFPAETAPGQRRGLVAGLVRRPAPVRRATPWTFACNCGGKSACVARAGSHSA